MFSTVIVVLLHCTPATAAPASAQPHPAALFYQPREHPVIAPPLSLRLSDAPATQPVAVWVFFTDKAVTSQADYAQRLAARRAELPPRTLQRRGLRRTAPGLLDERDLAVHPAYVAGVQSTGARLRREIRWLNAVSMDASPAQIAALAALPFVRRIAPVATLRRPLPAPNDAPPPGGFTPAAYDQAWYGGTWFQHSQAGIAAAHAAGYSGAGVVIGVLDTGFRRTHTCFNQTDASAAPPVHPLVMLSEHDYVNNDGNTGPEAGDPTDQAWHGTAVLGILGAFRPGTYVGAAYDAQFRLAKTENIASETPAEEDNYAAALMDFETAGVDVATSSLGYFDFDAPYPSYTLADLNGHTAVTTVAVNVATDNGMICCTAAGNEGHDANPATLHLIAPADAYRVITCGGVTSAGLASSFSSDGPSFDGRVKPEVLARGSSTALIDPENDNATRTGSGTSFATPIIAGGCALIVQAHPDWSVDRVRRALIHTAGDFAANSTYDPTYVRGYGIINVMSAIQYIEGDINNDGTADGDDVAPFLSALSGLNGSAAQRRNADVDASGMIDAVDVELFVNDLLGR